MTSGEANNDEVFKCMVATREAKWLLSSEIAEYLDEQIYNKAIDLQTLAGELKGVSVGDVRSKNVRAQAEIKKWFVAQYGIFDALFAPFLQLRH